MRIENSITRETVGHHEACRARPVIPSDRIFNSYLTTIIDSFSCIRFLRQLHLSLNMHYFIHLTLKYLHLGQMFGSAPIYDSQRFGEKWHKNVKKTSRRHARVVLHPPVRRHFLAPVNDTEIHVRYARRMFHVWNKRWQKVNLNEKVSIGNAY